MSFCRPFQGLSVKKAPEITRCCHVETNGSQYVSMLFGSDFGVVVLSWNWMSLLVCGRTPELYMWEGGHFWNSQRRAKIVVPFGAYFTRPSCLGPSRQDLCVGVNAQIRD